MPGGIRAIVLDLDGTLVDSAPELAHALNAALVPMGRRAVEATEVRGMIGDGVAVLTRRALAATGTVPEGRDFDAVLTAVRAAYDHVPASPLYPGVAETLRALHRTGFRIAVCTNKPEGPARRLMAQLDLEDLVDALAGGDTYAVKKPDPGHVRGLLRALGIDGAAAVMVGDSANDAHAARGAGTRFIAVSYGYCKGPVAALDADAVIDSFAELPGAIGAL